MNSQDLDPSTAAYFVFVTLTTIGFGDITPEDSYKSKQYCKKSRQSQQMCRYKKATLANDNS
jgi:Ion channel